MYVDPIAVCLILLALLITIAGNVVLSRKLRAETIARVIAEVNLRHYTEDAAFKKARDITKR